VVSKREANQIILSGHPEVMSKMTLGDLERFVKRAKYHGATMDEVPSIRVDFKGAIRRITVTIENTPFNYAE
jgi:hypothetical protein